MPDFFCGPETDGLAPLGPEDARHALRVLRMRPGDAMKAVVGGRRYRATLETRGDAAFARLLSPLPGSEARTAITLYQGLPKGEKLEQVVRQATELGVFAIVPCVFARSVPRPEGEGRKADRLNRIAHEAAMQSGRTVVPRVEDTLGFEALLARLPRHGQALVPYEMERGQTLRAAYRGADDVALVIGPEGGFTPEEIRAMPAVPVTLGPRVLRTETAGVAAIAMLLALADDFAGR